MNTSERDLVLRWFEAQAEEKLARHERDEAEEVLKRAQAKTTNVEQLLYEITPEKTTRRFYIRAFGKLRLVEIHRKSGSFGVDGIYEQDVEDLGSDQSIEEQNTGLRAAILSTLKRGPKKAPEIARILENGFNDNRCKTPLAIRIYNDLWRMSKRGIVENSNGIFTLVTK